MTIHHQEDGLYFTSDRHNFFWKMSKIKNKIYSFIPRIQFQGKYHIKLT